MTEKSGLPSCAACSGVALGRSGTRPVRRASVAADGRVERETVPAQRYRCRDCGRMSVGADDDRTVVDTVSDSAMRVGVAGAAARHGIDPGTVSRMLVRWIDARREDADRLLPDVVAVSALRSGEPLRLIVSDPGAEGLLDIVDGVEGLRAYAVACGTAPELVSIEVDARLAASVRGIWPKATLAVPPSAAIRSVSVAALSTFRSLVRDGVSKGRNFRERPGLLRIANEDLTEAQADEMQGWSAPLKRLRAAVLLLLDGLRSARPKAFSDILGRVLGSLRELSPGGALTTLLSTWKAEICAGVAERWLDPAWLAVDALRRQVASSRPAAGLDVLRAILVFSVPRSRLPAMSPSYGGVPAVTVSPRTISGAMEALLLLSPDRFPERHLR